MAEDIRETALRYHREGRPGKIEVVASKLLANQRDLSRAYTPGVAQASLAISEDSAMAAELTVRDTIFITDTYVTPDPTVEEIAEMTHLPAEEVRRFGLTPMVGLLSHSNFGSSNFASAQKMRKARQLVHERDPDLQVEGEIDGDAAIDSDISERIFPNSFLDGQANFLVMLDQDAANIAFNLLKTLADGLAVGPILVSTSRSAHILTPSVMARGILNMSAVAAVGAQYDQHEQNLSLKW
ncbi:MAG: hypothetical protein CL566_01605 [Alphaproteobacteria bacterium]|nr:hypothetical protein [Alphaproteobacteria bacterium]|tara:strand:- start:62 stop:781 length:720 start_codon:yes stop_codon:yes gene_type:complete